MVFYVEKPKRPNPLAMRLRLCYDRPSLHGFNSHLLQGDRRPQTMLNAKGLKKARVVGKLQNDNGRRKWMCWPFRVTLNDDARARHLLVTMQ